MDQIQTDIASTITPSWLTSAPSNLGSASHGKLKVDVWRILGSVYLPISLIRLWWSAVPGNARSERCQKILDITISLLSAVSIATSRVTSPQHADLYLQHMQAYLTGLKELFPEFKFVPNQHMALHLPDYILLYGPVHSWWAFPFERMIGTLQRISTNCKEGEYEETIARSFVRSANLRRILEQTGTPEVIQNCKSMFRKLVDPQVRGTLVTDLLSFAMDDLDDVEEMSTSDTTSPLPKIPDSLTTCLQESFGGTAKVIALLPNLTMKGIIYSAASRHAGNSSILIHSGLPGVLIPAQIQCFVQLVLPDNINTPVTFVAAQRYLPVNVNRDPFSAYPFLRAKLWSRELDSLGLYTPESIESHFAHCPMEWEEQQVMAIISLSRVSYLLNTIDIY